MRSGTPFPLLDSTIEQIDKGINQKRKKGFNKKKKKYESDY